MRKLLIAILMLAYGTTALAGQSSHPGGSAPAKISAEGKENTNAKWSAGADKGQARAEERRSTQGATHEKSREGSHPAVKEKSKKRTHQNKKKPAGKTSAAKQSK